MDSDDRNTITTMGPFVFALMLESRFPQDWFVTDTKVNTGSPAEGLISFVL